MGAFTGWLYSLLFAALFATFIGVWRGIRKLPELTDEKRMRAMGATNSTLIRSIFYGVIAAGVAGFVFKWWYGLIVAVVIAMITAFVVTVQTQRVIRKMLK